MRMPNATLRRLFWSIYGWLAWDSSSEPWTCASVQTITARVLDLMPEAGSTVLDAGCGTGNHAVALAAKGYQVTGIDNARGMLARARSKGERLALNNLVFEQVSLDDPLPYTDGAFDIVLNISVLQTVSNATFTLSEMRRVLRPNGYLILLHAPRPAHHSLPFAVALTHKASELGQSSWWRRMLLAPKLLAERRGRSRYWTQTQLIAMMEHTGFRPTAVSQGPPIVVVAHASAKSM